MHILSRLVLHIVVPELADVFDFILGKTSVSLHVCTSDIYPLYEQLLSLGLRHNSGRR